MLSERRDVILWSVRQEFVGLSATENPAHSGFAKTDTEFAHAGAWREGQAGQLTGEGAGGGRVAAAALGVTAGRRYA